MRAVDVLNIKYISPKMVKTMVNISKNNQVINAVRSWLQHGVWVFLSKFVCLYKVSPSKITLNTKHAIFNNKHTLRKF